MPAHLIEFERRDGHDFLHPRRIRVVIDIHLPERDIWSLGAKLCEKGPYPSTRRAPLGCEVQYASFPAALYEAQR